MKKFPYCAEEIPEEAILCRFCNKEFKPHVPGNKITSFVWIFLILIGAFGLYKVIANSYDEKHAEEVSLLKYKSFVSSVCSEFDSIISFAIVSHTYGEAVQKIPEIIAKLKSIKSDLLSSEYFLNGASHKSSSEKILVIINDALSYSENALASANYFIDNENAKNQIRNLRAQAERTRAIWNSGGDLDVANRQQADQLDISTNSMLSQVALKEGAIAEKDQASSSALISMIQHIDEFRVSLVSLGLDFDSLFSVLAKYRAEAQAANAKGQATT